MNQILVNEHDPKKNKEAKIDSVQPLNEVQSNSNNINQPFDMQPSFDSMQSYDSQSDFNNMQTYDSQPDFNNMQSYNSQSNSDSMQTYDSQLGFSNMQAYDSQSNFDNMQSYSSQSNYDSMQTYDSQPNFNGMQPNSQSSYDEQVNYDLNQSYQNTQPDYTTGNYESKTIQKVEIQKVVRIFCIVIIIFGLVLGGKAIFTFVKSKNNKKDTPVVNIDKMGREATISISTQKPIKQYSYQWNKDGEPEVEQGNGRVSVEKTIQIPNGNNILNIVVTDYYGNKTKYFKQYIYESTDITKPTINLSAVGNKLKITAEDETEILYMTYSWNDEEEIRVDVSQDNKKIIEEEIEVPEGQNKLTITAVDKEENKEKRTENIVGDNKPTFDIQTDGENIIVVAKDDEGVSKIEITVDDVTTDSGDTPINQTEVTAKLPISRGTHTITVTVTNLNGLSETNTVTHTF